MSSTVVMILELAWNPRWVEIILTNSCPMSTLDCSSELVNTLPNSELYAQIQAQEDAIEKLQAIKAKPKSLLAEIKKRQAGIEALVAFMDEREAKRNPQPAQPAKPTGPDLQTLQVTV